MTSGIIVAAGRGRRMGKDINKVFLKIKGKEILKYTVDTFLECSSIDEIVVVTGKEDISFCEEMFSDAKKSIKVVAGGETRQESVYNGIIAASGDIVAIHDGARALITKELVSSAVEDAKTYGASALGVVAKDTIKLSDEEGFIKETLDRSHTYQIQTPQVFKREEIKRAHEIYGEKEVTDDCALAEMMGIRIKITQGSYENIKITTPEDLLSAEGILSKR